MPTEEQPGMPIYLDQMDRRVVDFNDDDSLQPAEWHPMNTAATRLCRCHVALGDVQEAVEHYLSTADPKKRRRRIRAVSIPLHNLCEGIIDTINAIQSDQSIHDRLPPDATKQLSELRTRFVSLVPFDRKGKLGIIRNRISAHLDKSEFPSDMREIVRSADPTEFGEWIHCCVGLMCDLLKLDAYRWTATTQKKDTIITMFQEPIMAVLRVEDGKVVEFAGALLRKRSPKHDIFEAASSLCESSQQLFERHSSLRISGFREDDPKDGWARMLRDDVANQQEQTETARGPECKIRSGPSQP